MPGTFDFAPNSHSAVEIAPDEQSVVSFNGWDFTSRPSLPYRRKFRLRLSGMRWYISNGALDVTTNPTLNAGRLLDFYRANRRYGTFTYQHEYLGSLTCRFAEALAIPEALPNAAGLIDAFEVTLVHHSPSY